MDGREPAEVVRALFATLSGDSSEDPIGLLDPDIEWEPMEGKFRGIEGVIRNLAHWLEPWEEHRIELEEIEPAGEDVLAVVHLTGRGSGSGMEIDQRFFEVYSVLDGKIVRMREFPTRGEALEAAGATG